jgi:hypothetical protein
LKSLEDKKINSDIMKVTCKLAGGLGNQLFQIFTVMSYAFENERQFVFCDDKVLNVGKTRPTYWNTLLKKLKDHTVKRVEYINVYQEIFFHYSKIPHFSHEHITLVGYFQSYLYFKDFYDLIYQYLEIDTFKDKYKEHDFNQVISLHFRIDDYVKHDKFPVLDLNYYINAIKAIKTTNYRYDKFLIFYQPCDEAIVIENKKKLESIFTNDRFTLVNSKIPDFEQMIMMSLCKCNIIANSTFSWWGAYLGNNNIVYYPDKWFNDDTKVDDLFPKRWISIPST